MAKGKCLSILVWLMLSIIAGGLAACTSPTPAQQPATENATEIVTEAASEEPSQEAFRDSCADDVKLQPAPAFEGLDASVDDQIMEELNGPIQEYGLKVVAWTWPYTNERGQSFTVTVLGASQEAIEQYVKELSLCLVATPATGPSEEQVSENPDLVVEEPVETEANLDAGSVLAEHEENLIITLEPAMLPESLCEGCAEGYQVDFVIHPNIAQNVTHHYVAKWRSWAKVTMTVDGGQTRMTLYRSCGVVRIKTVTAPASGTVCHPTTSTGACTTGTSAWYDFTVVGLANVSGYRLSGTWITNIDAFTLTGAVTCR